MLLNGVFLDATDEKRDLLRYVCTRHNDGMALGNFTVLTCWNADCRHLGRVGIAPNSRYLGTVVERTA
jgi:hypothetical protein